MTPPDGASRLGATPLGCGRRFAHRVHLPLAAMGGIAMAAQQSPETLPSLPRYLAAGLSARAARAAEMGGHGLVRGRTGLTRPSEALQPRSSWLAAVRPDAGTGS